MESLQDLWLKISRMSHVYEVGLALCILVIGLLTIHFCRTSLTLFAQRNRISPITLRPVHYVIRWGGYVIIIALILTGFGVPVVTMVGTLAAMVALGFVAIWSVLTNITCTLLLIIFQPFQIEDEIEFPTEQYAKGRVQDMNFLYTTLVTPEGDQYQIPNNLFFQKVFRRRKGVEAVSLENHVEKRRT